MKIIQDSYGFFKNGLATVILLLFLFSFEACTRHDDEKFSVKLCHEHKFGRCDCDTSIYQKTVQTIYCDLSLLQVNDLEKIKISWFFLSDKKVLIKEESVKLDGENKNHLLTLDKPENGWPIGMYEVKLTSNHSGFKSIIKSFLIE